MLDFVFHVLVSTAVPLLGWATVLFVRSRTVTAVYCFVSVLMLGQVLHTDHTAVGMWASAYLLSIGFAAHTFGNHAARRILYSVCGGALMLSMAQYQGTQNGAQTVTATLLLLPLGMLLLAWRVYFGQCLPLIHKADMNARSSLSN